jgi:hypothetical protein
MKMDFAIRFCIVLLCMHHSVMHSIMLCESGQIANAYRYGCSVHHALAGCAICGAMRELDDERELLLLSA